MPNTIGVILNGGKSSRMGQDKSSLPYQGQSLLTHTANLLTQAGVVDIRISGKGGVVDTIAHLGPLGGLYTMMDTLELDQTIIILPVDMPLLQAPTLSTLIAANHHDTPYDAIYFEGFMMPLLLTLTTAVRDHITCAITHKKRLSIQYLLEQVRTHTLPVATHDYQYFDNINTPAQYQHIT